MVEIGARKSILYGAVILVLGAANLWSLGYFQSPGIKNTEPSLRENIELLGSINDALERSGFSEAARRDLFRFAPRKPLIEQVVEEPKPNIISADNDAAQRAVEKIFEDIRVLGVIAAGSNLSAIVEYDKNLKTFSIDDLVVDGFRVDSISLMNVVIVNDTLSISRSYELTTQ